MTDLTKKYQNCELPEGVYYVTYPKNDTPEIDIYRMVYSLYDDSEVRFTIPSVEKVLKKVPSYDEYENLLKENIQLRIARNSLIETINKYREHAYKAMKMLDDLFYTSNHKLKAYECCQELSEIIKNDEELLKKVRCLDDSRD
jgi:hypothetical protein